MPIRVGFLFLTGIHHLFHTVGIAQKLAETGAGTDIVTLSCTPEHDAIVSQLRRRWPAAGLNQVILPQPLRFKYLNYKGKSYPSPHDTIRISRKLLNTFDYLVTTSHVTKKICRKYGITRPKFVYVSHGCGDRAYGFEPIIGTMDLVLVPGQYYRDRFLAEKILLDDQVAVTGYAKLDLEPITTALPQPLFPQTRPTVLYTPHWDPAFSSFRKWGKQIFDLFEKSTTYNFILAPHLLLKHWKKHYRYDLDSFTTHSSHIHVDWGSLASVDTTYLRLADIYMGDVSSQVTEWAVIKPRPCIFMNAHGIDWEHNPDYTFWHYGPVVSDLGTLEQVLGQSQTFAGQYRQHQIDRVGEILARPPQGASRAGADAIKAFINSQS